MTRDLIDRAEALKAIQDYAVQELGAFRQPVLKGAADAIAAIPAVTVDAAALLKDVPRHSLDFCDRMEIDKDGVWMHEDHVLAALKGASK